MKKILYLILMGCLLVNLAACDEKEDVENSNDIEENVLVEDNETQEITYEYTFEEDETLCVCWVNSNENNLPEVISIPSEIDGKMVTAVENTFEGDDRGVKEVVLPNTIKEVRTNTFAFVEDLEKIIIESAETIEQEAIMGCKDLKELWLGDGVKCLDYDAVYACENLKEVHMSASVESIDETSCFYGCSPDLTIYAPAGSYAEQWANQMGYNFQAE